MLTVISQQNVLEEHCRCMLEAGILALDTEFVRTRTLKPQLGLVQIFYNNQLALIDPSNGLDLQPLRSVIASNKVVKVVHACSEDIEAIIAGLDVVPAAIFDTQFALALLNKGVGWGYGKFVQEYLGVTLEKAEARTDWLARPLSQQQLSYAADDVIYLFQAYQSLRNELGSGAAYDIVLKESGSVIERKLAYMPISMAFLQISNTWRLQAKQRTVLQYLAAWRLKEARKQDLALNFVIKESFLIALSQRMPTSLSGLHSIPELPAPTKRQHGQTIVKLVAKALQHHEQLAEGAHIPKLRRVSEFAAYKQTASALHAAFEEVARAAKVPIEVLASKKQVNQLLSWWWLVLDENRAMGLKPDLLRGWRGALCEHKIREVLDGEPPQQHDLFTQVGDIEHDLCDL
jgi:ribonuclease D